MSLMKISTLSRWLLSGGIVLAISFSTVFAQNNNNNNNDDETSTASGVLISAEGVLRRSTSLDYGGQLSQHRILAAKKSYSLLPQSVKAQSKLRYVSLNRLEKAIIDANGAVTDEMRYLVGIQRIRFVFYFPESKDIVIAGHAEGWLPGYEGVMVGATTNQPVCELQDLVTALRAYRPGTEGESVVGCSIDPTPEGNARLQEFIKRFGRSDGPGRREAFVAGLRQSLGPQTVRVDGIPANTHAALVLVSADYRMKRIGIGVETPPVDITTFIERVDPKKAGGNALYRWFFVPDYESVVMTEDANGLELTSNRVKLLAEDEIVTSSGERVVKKGKMDNGSRDFSRSFTEMYPKLAQKAMVYAQLRNFIDMLVCAAHIQKQDFYGKSGWKMETLGNESKYAVQVYNAPTSVEPVVGMRVKGPYFMAPIGGGVEIETEQILKAENVKPEKDAQITNVMKAVKLDLKPGQWWWD